MFDLTGQKLGRLRVIERVAARGPVKWKCVCECGNEAVVPGGAMVDGRVLGCTDCVLAGLTRGLSAPDPATLPHLVGVHEARWIAAAERAAAEKEERDARRQTARERAELFATWKNIQRRCNDPLDVMYKNYGARGVRMDPEWSADFEAFLRAIGPKPSQEHRLLLKDVNGNYAPGNVEWRIEPWEFRKHPEARTVEIDGESLTISQIAERAGVSEQTVYARWQRGVRGRELLAPGHPKRTFAVGGENLSYDEVARRSRMPVDRVRRLVRSGIDLEAFLRNAATR